MNTADRIPVISVVMPVCNGGVYLPAAVESILTQSFRDYEFILIDDGSTDDSQEQLRRYAQRDSRIHLVCQPKRGLIRTLNRGLRLACGKFVARMDADDISEPDRFAEQLEYLRDNPDCVAVGSSILLIDPDGDSLGEAPCAIAHEAIVNHLLDGIGAIPHPAAMMRREAVVGIGGYRDEYPCAEDLDLWLRLAEIGRLANLPQPLLHYRLHAKSITHQHRETQLASAQRAVRDALLRRGLPVNELAIATPKAESRAKRCRRWCRTALRAGNLDACRKHGWAALREQPLSPSNLGVILNLVSAGFRSRTLPTSNQRDHARGSPWEKI